jgi:hypothetical protein
LYKDFIDFKLKTAIGSDKKELVLYGPRHIHLPLTAKIDNMIMSGIMKLQSNVSREPSNNDSGELSDMKASDIVAMLKVIPSDDYSFYMDFCETFKALLLSTDICKFKDDNKQMAEGHYDAITKADGERLMGEYLKNFFIK